MLVTTDQCPMCTCHVSVRCSAVGTTDTTTATYKKPLGNAVGTNKRKDQCLFPPWPDDFVSEELFVDSLAGLTVGAETQPRCLGVGRGWTLWFVFAPLLSSRPCWIVMLVLGLPLG